jgi:hypothetical protein
MKTLKRILTLAVVTGVAALFVESAFADDIQPPPWRGQWSTTSQMWEFLNPLPNPLLPDGPAPGGMPPLPSTHIEVFPLGDWIALDPQSGRRGIWPLSGEMLVTVDNHNPPNDVKHMWVQVTWQDMVGLPATGPILSGFNPPPGTPLNKVGPVDLGLGWWETTYMWEIYPNPPDEFFILGGNILVDELVIDTWCIPEPSVVTLAGLGVLSLVWRQRASRA